MTQGDAIKVLIIDDEEIVHASVGRILSRGGFETDAVYSAQDGLDRLEQTSYSLVITDLMMPLMNGIELLQAMREREIQTPVIMITGYPTISTALQAMRLGAMDYLAKPFTRKELLSPVKRALRVEAKEPVAKNGSSLDAAHLLPGAEIYLPHHSWARYRQDGVFEVGVEETFLAAVGGDLVSASCPDEQVMADQGVIGICLTTAEGEEHGVAMPLSGEVVQVNRDALATPGKIELGTWLVCVLPAQLAEEVGNLMLRSEGNKE